MDILVTGDGDTADFQHCLDRAGAAIEVQDADTFLCMIAERFPALVRHRYLDQVAYRRRRDRVTEEVAADASTASLDKAGAGRFAFLLGTDERFRIW